MRRLTGIWNRRLRISTPMLLAGSYALLVAALIGVNYYTLVIRKQDYIDTEQRRLMRLGSATGMGFEYILDLTEFAMIRVAAQTASDNTNPEKVRSVLDVVTKSLPFIRTIGVVGLDGKLVIASSHNPAHEVHLGEESYVSYYLKGGHDPIYVSALHRDVIDGAWEISMSRPIFDRRRHAERGPDCRHRYRLSGKGGSLQILCLGIQPGRGSAQQLFGHIGRQRPARHRA